MNKYDIVDKELDIDIDVDAGLKYNEDSLDCESMTVRHDDGGGDDTKQH